ncbi:MAG: bifunctional DNA-formamidopyrimidine glycosylase/DNA-(apurinic or apyrimidinic site) lyase [Gemmatimonadaceae bacterium]|nr:bifunctional DNA-formamidopyrimidine glycosylase/DNA-(apurinic or apyrimidinic site) lyase [Gemmatimonadaceae bacterium]
MPELPEVEHAVRVARDACQGKRLRAVRALHASQRRSLPDEIANALTGDTVVAIDRRGKHQLLRLASGRTLHVHFRMTGDWRVATVDDSASRTTRVVLDFEDGTRLALDDARALATVAVVSPGVDPCPDLGPEATDPAFNAEWLAHRLALRRGPIKPALLDQRLVAGIGNIYASESLWYARIDPRRAANRLRQLQYRALAAGVKRAMQKALERPERYYGALAVSDAVRFNVYQRDGKGCRRCRSPITRLVQGGRSTYYCRQCQR